MPAYQLLSIEPDHNKIGRPESKLVGRRWETAAGGGLTRAFRRRSGQHCRHRGTTGHREKPDGAARLPRPRRISTWMCTGPSANPGDVPFPSATRLLRSAFGLSELDDQPRGCGPGQWLTPMSRDRCCSTICWASPEPGITLPKIDPDARRRRLTALINSASLDRARSPLCTSSRISTGSTRSANRCRRFHQGGAADLVDGRGHLPAEYRGRLAGLARRPSPLRRWRIPRSPR